MQYVPGRTPLYVGPRPLLAVDGGTHARLNEEPNLDVKLRTSPTHQRTIFDKLSFSLFYTDDDGDITSLPEPLQTFVGYRSLGEGVDKATLYVSLEEERSMSIEPIFIQNSTTVDNEVLFHENGLVEVLNADPSATSFLQNGFAANQLVTVSGVDTTDNRKRATLANNGRTYRILDVRANSLLLDVTDAVVVAESNVKTTTVSNAPYLDGDGIPRTERRVLTVTFKQAPTQIAELLVIGHTEGEDARYKLALENVGRGIKPKDLFIFKEYDISESGVDWIILNRKRKEMLQVQSEIYNYLSSYKSVAAAIDYFGYSDLEFVEYFLNVDQDSKNFGKLFSSELIDLLNRSVPGHTKKNANAEHLPNDKFRKTNLFSLSYRITDLDGNFVEGYNFDEVTTKLFGLQQWLEDNVIPVGSRITDINGKAVAKSNFTVRHNTFGFQHVKTRDGFSPVLCKVQGYKSPVQISETVTRPVPNSTATEQVMVQRINTYNITVKGETSTNVWPDAVHVRITTFGLPEWRPNSWYKPGDSVYSNGAVWVYTNAHASVGKDIIDPTYWSIGQELNPVPVQIVERTMYSAADSVLLTVDKESDPHFKVEVTSFNGYGGVWKEAKTYSVNYGAWPNA